MAGCETKWLIYYVLNQICVSSCYQYSNSEISFLNFKKVGDKGVSVGENSSINIQNVKGEN